MIRFLFKALLGRRLPIVSGSISVHGIDAAVRIRRDRWGIPHIDAESDADGWFGLGFCQGQDRGFQLEILARTARGTLSEVVGPKALPVDRLSRRIGFHRNAVHQFAAQEADVRRDLEAFAAGVTAGMNQGLERRPHEYVLLRFEPTTYSAVDAVGMLGLLSFGLAANWDAELMRLQVLTRDGHEALRAIDPIYREWFPVTTPATAVAGRVVDQVAHDLQLLSEAVGKSGCSNNWVLSGARTASGRPLLANDPHLTPILPPHWYLAHVTTPKWSTAGAAFAGTPGIASGHNGHCAWGVTAGLVDNTDFFIEEMGPDGKSVRSEAGYEPCEVIRETIRIRGQPDHEEEVLVTPRGPVMSTLLDGVTQALSLRGVWMDAHPVGGFLRVPATSSFGEFRAQFAQWPLFSLNLVYADTTGRTGWFLAGQAPRRRRGRGTLPLPGWQPENGWREGLVPFSEMPFEKDPPAGFIATANNKPLQDGSGPYLGADWLDGYRVMRIREALSERADWELDGMSRVQMDTKSMLWHEIRDVLLTGEMIGETIDADAGLARQLLRVWDGDLSAESPAAAVFQFFLHNLYQRFTGKLAPNSTPVVLGKGCTPMLPRSSLAVRRAGHLSELLKETALPPGTAGNDLPISFELGAAVLSFKLGAAVRDLKRLYGDDPRRWHWGKIRPLRLRHPLGRGGKLLAAVYNRGPFPCGGDANTVAQAATDLLDPVGDVLFTASLRMAIDVGEWDTCRFALPGGQSGNPVSPHYDDQLPLFNEGKGIPIAWGEDSVERATVKTLRLTRSSHETPAAAP